MLFNQDSRKLKEFIKHEMLVYNVYFIKTKNEHKKRL